MAYIGVVILTANGFAGVMNATGDIDSLVKSLTGLTGNHKLISIVIIPHWTYCNIRYWFLFATIPIIASLFIPLEHQLV